MSSFSESLTQLDRMDDVQLAGHIPMDVPPHTSISVDDGSLQAPEPKGSTQLPGTASLGWDDATGRGLSDSEGEGKPAAKQSRSSHAIIDSHGPSLLADLPTGLCYDDRMIFHKSEGGTHPDHPEDPSRIKMIYETLRHAGLVAEASRSAQSGKTLVEIDAREATRDEILLIHTAKHFDFVESTTLMSGQELWIRSNNSDSVYFNGSTFLSSKVSVGGAIESCLAVLEGRVRNAIAVIRPPGHHAVPHEPQGFCIFNNVCVAAKVCQERFPGICRKVLIFDWYVQCLALRALC